MIFSSTLECLRQHPAVSDGLNDLAIADFLLLQRNQDPGYHACSPTSTVCRRRTRPPGPAPANNRRRYWTMPVDPPLLLTPVRRLLSIASAKYCGSVPAIASEPRHTGIFMSGGLDSTSMGSLRVPASSREHSSGSRSLCALTKDDLGGPSRKAVRRIRRPGARPTHPVLQLG